MECIQESKLGGVTEKILKLEQDLDAHEAVSGYYTLFCKL